MGIDISAPGYKINSTVIGNKYQTATGTSMSAPVVAGALALVWSKHPEWSKEQVISRLISTADNIDDKNAEYFHDKLGSGRVNLEKAVGEIKQRPISILGLYDRLKTISDRFSIRVSGVVDWRTLTDDTVSFYKLSDDVDVNSTDYENLIATAATELEISIADKDKLSYGSNKFEIINKEGNLELGKYLVKVKNNLKDPFGNSFDVNNDGLAGQEEHYYKIVELELEDYYSPLLSSYELIGEKVLTPESENIKYRFNIDDDLSRYGRIVVELRNSSDFSELFVIRCSKECLMEDGSVEVEVPIKSFKTNGRYYIRHILIADKTGKSSAYYVRSDKEQVYKMPSHAKNTIELKDSYFELKGFQEIDRVAPVLLSKPIAPKEVLAGSKLELKLEVKEELSGMKRIIAKFTAMNLKLDLNLR